MLPNSLVYFSSIELYNALYIHIYIYILSNIRTQYIVDFTRNFFILPTLAILQWKLVVIKNKSETKKNREL